MGRWKKTEKKQYDTIIWDYVEMREGKEFYTNNKIILSPYEYSSTNRWQVQAFMGYEIRPGYFPTKEKALAYAMRIKKTYS